MQVPPRYLLNTNIVLHATRENSLFGRNLDTHLQLSALSIRPTICEVSVGELRAFALGWGVRRRERLERVIDALTIAEISDSGVYERWAELYSHARNHGLAIQHDHNDVWIAAAAHVGGATLLSTDKSAFLPLRGTDWVDVVVLDAKTGLAVP